MNVTTGRNNIPINANNITKLPAAKGVLNDGLA